MKLQNAREGMGLFLVYVTVFIDMLGQSIVTPIMPFYAQEFGATAQEVGLIMTVYAGCQLVSILVSGKISDKIGRRPVLLTFLIGSAVFFFLQGLAWNLNSFIAFRGLAGLFGGSPPIAQAYVADSIDEAERPKYLAYVGSTIGMAFMFGPAIGSGLAQFSLSMPMYVSACTSLVAFFVALFLLPETNREVIARKAKYEKTPIIIASQETFHGMDGDDADAEKDARQDLGGLSLEVEVQVEGACEGDDGLLSMDSLPLSDEDRDEVVEEDEGPLNLFGITIVCLVAFLNMMAFQGFQSMFALYIEWKFQLGSLEIGFIFTGVAIVFIVTQMALFNLLFVKIGLGPTALIGAVCLAVSMGVLPIPNTTGGLFACTLVMGAGYSLVMPAVPVALSSMSPPSRQGFIISLGESASALARVIGPSLFGALFDLNPDFSFYAAGAFGAACCVTLIVSLALRIKPEQHEIPGIYIQREQDEFGSRKQLHELGEYFGRLLSVRHYRWVSNFEELKDILNRAFPALRPHEDDYRDDIETVVQNLSKIAIYLKTE